MTCEAAGCEATATSTVTCPFGIYELCGEHTDAVVPPETRYQSKTDPTLYIAGAGGPFPGWLER